MGVQLDRHRTHVPIPRKGRSQSGTISALPFAVAAGASLLIACVVLRVWDGSLSVPWTLGGEDFWSVLLYMKTTLEHVWPLHNPLLGAPFGQDLQDYPLGDPLQIIITKLLGIFSGDVGVVTNLFFLVTFPLTAMSAVWALRRLGTSTWTAVACAVLYALAPYHFFRGEDHLMIAAYYAVPFAAYLIVTQLAGDVLTVRLTVVLALLVGAAFTYYALFTLILLAFATLVSLAARRRTTALRGALALAVIAGVLAIVHVPTWIYDLQHGGNPSVAALHTPDESERYGLRIPRLVFPVEQHRISAFASLTKRFNERSPTQLQEGPPQALGLAGTIGFVALVWLGLTAAFRRREARRDAYLEASAIATLAALVLGMAGGVAGVIAYTVSPLLRSWSRLSIFIAFFAVFAIGRALDRAIIPWLRARGLRPAVVAAVVSCLVVIAAAEQTSPAMVPAYRETAAVWNEDAAFAARSAQLLPHGSFVFELPYVPFPESVYTQARPYLHTNSLRWTFGAMSGRPADWAASLMGIAPKDVITSAAAAGATGVFLNRNLYPNGGSALAAQLQALLGPPRVVSADGQLELYDLRPYAARVRARLGPVTFAQLHDLVLHPIRVLPASGLSGLKHVPQDRSRFYRDSAGQQAALDLINPYSAPRSVTLTIGVSSLGPGSKFRLTTPDGGHADLTANPNATAVGKVTLKPGHNLVRITDLTPPVPFEQDLFSLDQVVVQDPVVSALLRRAG